MAQGGGVPGIAVGMAGAAALLIYAGFQGTDPLTALRDVATGKPKGLKAKSGAHTSLYEGIGGSGGTGGGAAQASLTGISGPHPEFVTAVSAYINDQYSQKRRWQPGYSDCSSIVGKALKDLGITPPGASTTFDYLAWRKLKPIPKSQIGAGDFLVSSGHMVTAITATTAIGQQNGNDDVQIGPISRLMWGQSWVALRYTGTSSGAGSVMA
jgi:hypothetical protein